MITVVVAIVKIRRFDSSVTRTVKPSVGAAVRSIARAESTSKSGSGAPVNGD